MSRFLHNKKISLTLYSLLISLNLTLPPSSHPHTHSQPPISRKFNCHFPLILKMDIRSSTIHIITVMGCSLIFSFLQTARTYSTQMTWDNEIGSSLIKPSDFSGTLFYFIRMKYTCMSMHICCSSNGFWLPL